MSGRNSKLEGQGFSASKRQSDLDLIQATQSYQKQEEAKYFISSKVVMLGESGVGKSSLVSQFMHNRFMMNQHQEPTVSPHFVRKTQTIYKLGSQQVQFNIWDTAGQEKYRCLASMYFRDANVAIIVFDVTSAKTLDCIDYWVEELQRSNAIDYITILVGNKSDLS